MELLNAVKGRHSIRKFKPDPVQRPVIEDIVKNALWIPNWGNTQPWEIFILGPDIIKKISDGFIEKLMGGETMKPELEMPDSWPPEHKKRYVEVGRDLFKIIGISRDDKEARMNYYLDMFRFFGAPNIIYICMDKEINPHYGPFDIGALSSNICMLAHEKGIGTCVMACLAHYPDVIRKHVSIPDNKIIVIGLAMGYADESDPSFSFRSTRDESVISWHGFEE
ncbi:MAG: hypothetical protein GY863_08290 [bacterium]|nr:hypothetical protein [bacterium]